MVDETTETRRDDAPTHTTVIHERSSGSGTGIIMAVVLLIAVIGGIYLFSRSDSNEAAKDSAVAEAANSVGSAADQVGEAADRAADSVEGQQAPATAPPAQ